MISNILDHINLLLSEHPKIVGFRWSITESWGSTWSFLIFSISTYISTSLFLHIFLLCLFPSRRPIPLGPIPALHSFTMALLFAIIFIGTLFSTVAEIRDTRWFWQRFKTPFEWLFCFPIGTRSSGRVFFWSYIFYLSRFLHIIRTYFTILRRRTLSFVQIFNHSTLLCMSFLWLEFSQSYQVVEILLMSLVFGLIYGYRFWTEIGLPRAYFPLVINFHVILLGFNLLGHTGVLLLHFFKGGCNGMGAWVFNSVLSSIVLLMFLKFYAKFRHYYYYSKKAIFNVSADDDDDEEDDQPLMAVGKQASQ